MALFSCASAGGDPGHFEDAHVGGFGAHGHWLMVEGKVGQGSTGCGQYFLSTTRALPWVASMLGRGFLCLRVGRGAAQSFFSFPQGTALAVRLHRHNTTSLARLWLRWLLEDLGREGEGFTFQQRGAGVRHHETGRLEE